MSYFEFCIAIDDSKLVCCRQSPYGIHEREIMNTHIQILINYDWICECEIPLESLIILAPKPHQEGCTDINDFCWRLCVSYCPLNSATKTFEFPIPRYDVSIENVGNFSVRIF